MSRHRHTAWLGLPALVLTMGACASVSAVPVPATVDLGDARSRSAVETALAAAMKTAHVELGPVASDQTPVVTVLPRRPGPMEGNSTAMPVAFDIVINNGKCYARRRDTQAMYELRGANCRPQTH